MYMLDTNTVSYFLRAYPNVEKAVFALPYSEMCISVLTEAEIRFGIAKQPKATRIEKMALEFMSRIDSMPWTGDEALCYAQLRAKMAAAGKTLQTVDLLIAVHAISIGATLVTSDKAFQHVPDLKLENWL